MPKKKKKEPNPIFAPKRLELEVQEVTESNFAALRNFKQELNNLLRWTVLIAPDSPPYDEGAFLLEVNFKPDYPFMPPRLHFVTKVYHPNVQENGLICMPILFVENWKPTTRMTQVLQVLVALMNDPIAEMPIRADLGKMFLMDHDKYMRLATDFTKQTALPRPPFKKYKPPKK
ncbi:ubiquitin-conjugating enzyme E2-18 kDa-like [Teleopsis dalmanni]|uniref:ubiquitin-conjugating enzyme E2-18 kDa-like n=1 Tax=Teleopsis dalmanni TaxID=139649 RepID=UPI0018CF5E9E|nr:ubiquitin-conjugating enzyme E2-18 kDa-like [Teleopsis dalmanni]